MSAANGVDRVDVEMARRDFDFGPLVRRPIMVLTRPEASQEVTDYVNAVAKYGAIEVRKQPHIHLPRIHRHPLMIDAQNMSPAVVYVMTMLIADGYLAVPSAAKTLPRSTLLPWSILLQLPMELQMLLCNRLYLDPKPFIGSGDIADAMRAVIAYELDQ